MGYTVRLGVISWAVSCLLLVSSCAIPPPEPRDTSVGHVSTQTPPPASSVDIPEPVVQTPILPEPTPSTPVETYTVVVNEVPVKELLFALARDAVVNVDNHPSIEGAVTLNAIDQTLNQILDRISRQIDLAYELKDGVLVIGSDLPFLKSYSIDYVNMSRDSSSDIKTSTAVATTAGGGGEGGAGNTSDTTVSSISNHRVWETIAGNVIAILGEDTEGAGEEGGIPQTSSVIVNPEGGLITVRATSRQHAEIQKYLDLVMSNVRRQVLIETTIVEVLLDGRYQAGVDWQRISAGVGLTATQILLGGFTAAAGGATTGLILNQQIGATKPLDITLQLLQEFGETTVLSSPKLMTLNNQTALLKVVDNEVYFTVELQEDEDNNGNVDTTITSTINTVAVGVIMNITPQIDASDIVTLNIRPTISRIREFVADPGVQIIAQRLGIGAQIDSQVPVVQVRETETVLKVGSGQIAVLGGLMQDNNIKSTDQVPGVGDVDLLGEAFKFHDRNYSKTELVIFMRPWVIRSPDVNTDLSSFKHLLPENLHKSQPLKSTHELYME